MTYIDGWTGQALAVDVAALKAHQRHIRVRGEGYVAAFHPKKPLFTGFGGGEQSLRVVMACQSLPDQVLTADEVHYFASIHEEAEAGDELLSIGVTPSGRLAGRGSATTLFSSLGAVIADGVPREYEFFSTGSSRQLVVNGVEVATDSVTDTGANSLTGLPVRVMLFNGRDGLSGFDHSIGEAVLENENGSMGWLLEEGAGALISDAELFEGEWVPRADLGAVSEFGEELFPLTVARYDPTTLGLAPPRGPMPSGSATYGWGLATHYTPRLPAKVEYRPQASGA